MTYTRPDVYIEELPGVTTPLEVSTSIAGFVGISKRGIPNTPILCESWTDFVDNFALSLETPFLADSELAYAVYGFFQNGGNKVYINRVVGTGATKATVTMPTDDVAVVFTALDDGDWANNALQVEVEERNDGYFNIYIYFNGEMVEAFMYVTDDSGDANYFLNRINNGNSKYITAADGDLKDSTVAQVETCSVVGTVTLAGTAKITVTGAGITGSPLTLYADVANNDTHDIVATKVRAVLAANSAINSLYTVTVGTGDNDDDIIFTRKVPVANDATLEFVVENGSCTGLTLATSVNTTAGSGSHYLTSGADGSTPSDLDVVTGINDFDSVSDLNIIACPGLTSESVQTNLLAYATARGDCFAICDPVAGYTPAQIISRKSLLVGDCGALYYPCIKVSDPITTTNSLRTICPSGHIAGLYARIDASRGVHKAPAGVECLIRGAIDLETQLTNTNIGDLNEEQVNCIILKNGYITAWGARTCSTDPNKLYVSDVRFDQYIRDLCYVETTFAVFEPNDPVLWEKMSATLGGILHDQWLKGALQGAKSNQAYFVKCDAELNPVAVQERGEVIAEIGYAKKTPAEFVIIRIRQMSATSY